MKDRIVRQEHPSGCGIAVLAMLTGQTYAKTLKDYQAHFGQYDPVTEGIRVTNVPAFLWRHGLFTRTVASPDKDGEWPPRPFAPMHACEVNNPGGGHYVVMLDDGRILDPLDGTNFKQLTAWEVVYAVIGVKS